jgi:hypothetical protein
VRSIRNTSAARRFAVLVLALVAVVAGCTSDGDDPRAAVRSAATELREHEGTELRLRVSDGLDAEAVDADLAALSHGAELVLRSSRERAVHARLDLDRDPATTAAADAIGDRLSEVGLEPIGSQVRAGGWLRVANSPAGDAADPLGDALGGSLDRLAEGADEVSDAGGDAATAEEDGSDRIVRLIARRALVDDLVEQVVLVADVGTASTAPTADGDGGASATVDVHLAEGRVTELVVPVSVGGADVEVTVDVAEPDDPHDLPTDAQPFGLRALLRDLTVTAPTGADVDDSDESDDGDDGDAPGTDDASDDGGAPEDPDREPTPFREDGVLEEAFDGEDPFAETEFDCVTENDLDNIEAALGAEARAEVEELIEAGELERC